MGVELRHGDRVDTKGEPLVEPEGGPAPNWTRGMELNNHAVLESDCQEVVNLWQSKHERSVGAHVFWEMQTMLPSFQGFQLKFARRTANNVAHWAAREALYQASSSLSVDVTSDYLIEHVLIIMLPYRFFVGIVQISRSDFFTIVRDGLGPFYFYFCIQGW